MVRKSDPVEPPLKLVVTTCNQESAQELIQGVLRTRLAACCNCVPSVQSTYWWDNALTTDEECLLVFKTSADRLPELEAHLAQAHPYEVPEIMVLDPQSVFPAYADWVHTETSKIP